MQPYFIILSVFINQISALKLGYETRCDSTVYITRICWSAPLIYFILVWKWKRFLHSLLALPQYECRWIFLSKAESHNSIRQHVGVHKIRQARIMNPFCPSRLEYFWGLLAAEKERIQLKNSRMIHLRVWFLKIPVSTFTLEKIYFRLCCFKTRKLQLLLCLSSFIKICHILSTVSVIQMTFLNLHLGVIFLNITQINVWSTLNDNKSKE